MLRQTGSARFLLHLTSNLSPCYAFAFDEAKAMTEDGANVVMAHLGVTTKTSIGAIMTTILEEAPAKVQGLCNVAKSVNPDVIALCHGGPVSMHDDAQGGHRFYGASSVE
jgi:predicted TIM-barrel enzyme